VGPNCLGSWAFHLVRPQELLQEAAATAERVVTPGVPRNTPAIVRVCSIDPYDLPCLCQILVNERD
jgi:hypothetical protein